MAIPISPGVYTKIIDLSTYVQAVPGTIGFICIISKMHTYKVIICAIINTYISVNICLSF